MIIISIFVYQHPSEQFERTYKHIFIQKVVNLAWLFVPYIQYIRN